MFSPFVGFRGGKGVATGAGVVLAIAPLAFLGAFILWGVLVYLTGYVSLGSVVAAAVLPFLTLWLYPGRPAAVGIEAGLAALIIWMHRANIRRLLNGTESQFGKREGASS
jgi:glycerol-3-phosphate acyltransferase PlsY